VSDPIGPLGILFSKMTKDKTSGAERASSWLVLSQNIQTTAQVSPYIAALKLNVKHDLMHLTFWKLQSPNENQHNNMVVYCSKCRLEHDLDPRYQGEESNQKSRILVATVFCFRHTIRFYATDVSSVRWVFLLV
jgi:hypothetical protein